MRARISASRRSTPRIDVRRINWVDGIASDMGERFHSRIEKESGKSGGFAVADGSIVGRMRGMAYLGVESGGRGRI